MQRTRHFVPLALVTTALCGLPAAPGFAQAVPSAAELVKASERFQPQGLSHKEGGSIISGQEKAPVASAGDERFILGGVRIEGMTRYTPEDFAYLYKDLIGKSVSALEIQEITAKITNRYRTDGYGLAIAYVPKQTANDNDTLRIRVDEGRIGKVQFVGEQPPDSFYQETIRYVEKIRALTPVKTEALERYLLLMNDLPGNTARAVLRPSASDPGATDLFIYYVHKPVDALVATDNRGSAYLGRWQTTASAATNGALGLDERIGVRGIVTSPISELQYTDLQYDQPIGTAGTHLISVISYANTRPGQSLKDQHIKGESVDVLVRAVHPLLRSRLQNLYVRGTFDARNNATDSAGTNLLFDRVRSVRLGASYDRVNERGGVTIADGEFSQGIAGLGATDRRDRRSVGNADAAYSKLTLDLSHSEPLPHDFSVLLAGSGQYALSPLLSSEQFLLGGPAYGTAYDPGELAGDYGAAGKVELRYGQALSDPLVESYQLYSYYDIGSVWRKTPLGNQSSRDSLASTGVGVRSNFSNDVTGTFEVAFPLTHRPTSSPSETVRLYGGLSAQY